MKTGHDGLRCVLKAEEGGAALETLILLPLQILIICVIAQLAHFMVARQIVQYAAFAAARAAMVSDPNGGFPTNRWQGTTDTAGAGTDDRVKRISSAAMNVLSVLEFYHHGSPTWIGLPTGGAFRKDDLNWEKQWFKWSISENATDWDADFTVTVAYRVNMPIPFANILFAKSSDHFRRWMMDSCTMVRPWCTQSP